MEVANKILKVDIMTLVLTIMIAQLANIEASMANNSQKMTDKIKARSPDSRSKLKNHGSSESSRGLKFRTFFKDCC